MSEEESDHMTAVEAEPLVSALTHSPATVATEPVDADGARKPPDTNANNIEAAAEFPGVQSLIRKFDSLGGRLPNSSLPPRRHEPPELPAVADTAAPSCTADTAAPSCTAETAAPSCTAETAAPADTAVAPTVSSAPMTDHCESTDDGTASPADKKKEVDFTPDVEEPEHESLVSDFEREMQSAVVVCAIEEALRAEAEAAAESDGEPSMESNEAKTETTEEAAEVDEVAAEEASHVDDDESDEEVAAEAPDGAPAAAAAAADASAGVDDRESDGDTDQFEEAVEAVYEEVEAPAMETAEETSASASVSASVSVSASGSSSSSALASRSATATGEEAPERPTKASAKVVTGQRKPPKQQRHRRGAGPAAAAVTASDSMMPISPKKRRPLLSNCARTLKNKVLDASRTMMSLVSRPAEDSSGRARALHGSNSASATPPAVAADVAADTLALPQSPHVFNTEEEPLLSQDSAELQENNNSAELQENNPAELQENNPAELQENNPAELQENNPAELQENNPAELQENNSAEMQENNNSAELQENNSAELQENNSAELQENTSAELQENNSAELQENNSAELQENNSAMQHPRADSVLRSGGLTGNSAQASTDGHEPATLSWQVKDAASAARMSFTFVAERTAAAVALRQSSFVNSVGAGETATFFACQDAADIDVGATVDIADCAVAANLASIHGGPTFCRLVRLQEID